MTGIEFCIHEMLELPHILTSFLRRLVVQNKEKNKAQFVRKKKDSANKESGIEVYGQV